MKVEFLKNKTDQYQSNADSVSENGTATLAPPVIQFSSNEFNSAKSPCNRRIDEYEDAEDVKKGEDEVVKRRKLKDAYTSQTILELITLKSSDNKGSLDPYTQLIHTIYSPRDEVDKGIDLFQDLPSIKNSIDNAMTSGSSEDIQHAAEKLWEGYNNIPSKPGLPSLPSKGDNVKEIYDKLKQLHDMFEAIVVSGEIGEGVCDEDEQVRSGIGLVTRYSALTGELDFVNSKGVSTEGNYYDAPSAEWFQDEHDKWYIKSSYLPTLEAKTAARQ